MIVRTLSPEERIARVRHEIDGWRAGPAARAATMARKSAARLTTMERLHAQGALLPIDEDINVLLDAIMEGRDPDGAVTALAAIGRRALQPTLETWEHWDIRHIRAHPQDVDQNLNAVLIDIGEPAVEPLVAYLHQPTGPKHQAAWVLGYLGDRRAVEPLIAALDDPDLWVRWAAAHALGRLQDHRAVEGLAGRLRDRSPSVQYAAIEALESIADESTIEPLRRFLQTRSPNYRARRAGVVNAAMHALTRIAEDVPTLDQRTSTS